MLAGVAERAEVPHGKADHGRHRGTAIGLAFFDHPAGEHELRTDGDRAAQSHRRSGQQHDFEAQVEGGVEGAVRVVVEAVQDACLGAVRLHHLDGRERLLQAGGEVAVGETVLAGAAADAGSESCGQPNHRHADTDAGEGDGRAQQVQQHQRQQRPEDGGERPDQRFLQQIHDHGAVLIDAEHGVAHPGLTVVLERQVLGPLHHRHPQALIDVVPNPGFVVGQRCEPAQEHETADAEPDEQPIPHDAALVWRHGLLFLNAGGDVFLTNSKHHRLQRLQALANQHLVRQQVPRHSPNRHHEDGRHGTDRQEHDEVHEHGPDERPRPPNQLPQPPEAHGWGVASLQLGDGSQQALGGRCAGR